MLVKESNENYFMLKWLNKYIQDHKGFICGGCFKNIFNKEKVKDLDIFFLNRADFEDAVRYYDSQTVGYALGVDRWVSDNEAAYTFLYENENVKAYTDKNTGIRIELCCKIFGTPEEILNQFDFTIAKFAYYKKEIKEQNNSVDNNSVNGDVSTDVEYKILMHDKFFEHLHLKRLVTDDKILFPMSTLERSYRYAEYGYFPCKETKLKIADSIHQLTKMHLIVSDSLYRGLD